MPSSTDLYDVINRRRDVRAEFSGEPIDSAALKRVLAAAHAAPSVGHTQPWDFVLVRDQRTRSAFQHHVQTEREEFNGSLDPERQETFSRIKVEGIMESGLGVVVTYDASRAGSMSSGGTPSPMQAFTRPASRSRTSGWRPLPKALASDGSRSTGKSSLPNCSTYRRASGRSRGCAWAPSQSSRPSPISSATAGRRSDRSRRRSTSNDSVSGSEVRWEGARVPRRRPSIRPTPHADSRQLPSPSSCRHRMFPSGSLNHAAFSEPMTTTWLTVLRPGRS